MLTIITRWFPEEGVWVMKQYIDRDVCLSMNHMDEHVACGELIAVDNNGVTLWHMGVATVISWDDFDTVNVFIDDIGVGV